MKNLLTISAFLFASFIIQSCTSTETKKEITTEVTTESIENVASYECPMKCEGSKSDKVGKCPVCEMDLEKTE